MKGRRRYINKHKVTGEAENTIEKIRQPRNYDTARGKSYQHHILPAEDIQENSSVVDASNRFSSTPSTLSSSNSTTFLIKPEESAEKSNKDNQPLSKLFY